jgi:putative endonuclease
MLDWRQGEDIAAAYLEDRGWKVLERNFRKRLGEIDIIAAGEDLIAFVEVKTWKSDAIIDLEYSLNSRKKQIYITLSKHYLLEHREWENHYVRYDVLFVDVSSGRVKYLKNAFTENG